MDTAKFADATSIAIHLEYTYMWIIFPFILLLFFILQSIRFLSYFFNKNKTEIISVIIVRLPKNMMFLSDRLKKNHQIIIKLCFFFVFYPIITLFFKINTNNT